MLIQNKLILIAQNRDFKEASILLVKEDESLTIPFVEYKGNSFMEATTLIKKLTSLDIDWIPYFRKITFDECIDKLCLIYLAVLPEQVYVDGGQWHKIHDNLKQLNLNGCDHSILMKAMRYI